jgi:hypothetical protein
MRSPAGILLLECQSRSRMVVALSAAPAMMPRERRRSLVADMRPCASGGRIVRNARQEPKPCGTPAPAGYWMHLTDTSVRSVVALLQAGSTHPFGMRQMLADLQAAAF